MTAIMVDQPQIHELPAVADLARASFRATFGHLYPVDERAAFLNDWNAPDRLAAQLADPVWAIRVSRDAAGAPTGLLKLGPVDLPLPAGEPRDPRDIELHNLYMADTARGTGAAAALMQFTMDHARAAGAARLYLSVYIDNHRAQAFYRRYGFVEIGRNPFRVGSTVDDDRIWRMTL